MLNVDRHRKHTTMNIHTLVLNIQLKKLEVIELEKIDIS